MYRRRQLTINLQYIDGLKQSNTMSESSTHNSFYMWMRMNVFSLLLLLLLFFHFCRFVFTHILLCWSFSSGFKERMSNIDKARNTTYNTPNCVREKNFIIFRFRFAVFRQKKSWLYRCGGRSSLDPIKL